MRIFVYGTLKKGFENHFLLGNSKFVGPSKIKGFIIYDLGAYPGIVPGETYDEVYGEIYEVDEVTLAGVDRLEGEGFLYVRTKVEAVSEDRMIEVETYVYNRSIRNRKRLEKEWRRSA